MKRKTLYVVLALMVVGLVATTGIVSAFEGRIGFNSENREAIKAAIEAKDFNAWREAISETLTEENFNKIMERHENRYGNRELMREQMEAVEQALEAGDYDAWKAAIEGFERTPKIMENITEENFDVFVELYKARQEGDFETAKELAEELGIGNGPCIGGHFKNRIR